MKFIEMNSDNLKYRKYRLTDFDYAYDRLSNPDNMRYRFVEPYTLQETKEYIDWAIACSKQKSCINYRYAVEIIKTSEVIGTCELAFTDHDPAEITWELHRNYWGMGYGTEMGQTLLKLGFETLKLRRIVAYCNSLNIPSYKIMEKIGMRGEAHFIKSRRGNSVLNNIWCDRYMYAILIDEYNERKKINE